MKHNTLAALFTGIANAIRSKGATGDIIADDFPDMIDAITTGYEVQSVDNGDGTQTLVIDGEGGGGGSGGGLPDYPYDAGNYLSYAVYENSMYPYMNRKGYKERRRLSFEGLDNYSDDYAGSDDPNTWCTTGYIPFELGDSFSFSGMYIARSKSDAAHEYHHARTIIFDEDFNYLESKYMSNLVEYSQNTYTTDGNSVSSVTINYAGSKSTNARYIRFGFVKTGTPYITKN